MTHPIIALQAALVSAWRADADLAGLAEVSDAMPKSAAAPYVVIARHDLLPRDGDGAPGNEHRLLLNAWASDASRKAALAMADRLLDVALTVALAPEGLRVTLRRHDRTETAIDRTTGKARAALSLTFFTEPD